MDREKEFVERVEKYIADNPVKIEWDYRERLDKSAIKEILEKGIASFEMDIYEMNMDCIADNEYSFTANCLYPEFAEEFEKLYIEQNGEVDSFEENGLFVELISFIRHDLGFYPIIDLNLGQLLNVEITAYLTFYSNYDCTNSMDRIEHCGYLGSIYSIVNTGIRKRDYLYEHSGVYGASLLTIPFSITLEDFLELREKAKNSNTVKIPKGTRFGFFSSFLGSGSTFEKETYRTMTIPLEGETKYDTVKLEADLENSYNMEEVYGGIEFPEADIIFS